MNKKITIQVNDLPDLSTREYDSIDIMINELSSDECIKALYAKHDKSGISVADSLESFVSEWLLHYSASTGNWCGIKFSISNPYQSSVIF